MKVEEPVSPVIGLEDVRAAAGRLAGVAHRTPVFTSITLDAAVGAAVHAFRACATKCKNPERAEPC